MHSINVTDNSEWWNTSLSLAFILMQIEKDKPT